MGSAGNPAGNPRQLLYGSAAPAVSYLVATLTDGHTMRVPAVAVGDEKVFVLALGEGQTLKRWTAYDAAARPAASGGGL